MKITQKAYIIYLLLVFFLALALRIGMTKQFVGLSSEPDFGAQPDQIDYEMFAYRLSIGEGYTTQDGEPTARRTPGTSLTLLPVYVIWGRSYPAGRMWFSLLSALTCVIVALITRPIFGKKVALLAAVMLTFYPGHFYYSMHFLSEAPFAFFLAVAVWCTALSFQKEKIGLDIGAGILWGAALLTRAQIMFMIPLAFLGALFSRKARRKYLRHWSLQVIVVILVLMPWVARNVIVLGHAKISTLSGDTFWGANNELTFNDPAYRGLWVKTSILTQTHPLSGTEVERDQMAFRYGLQSIHDNLHKLPHLLFAKIVRLLSPTHETENIAVYWAFALGWGFVAPFMIVGSGVALKKSPPITSLLLLPFVSSIITAMIFWGAIRFRDTVAPPFIILAAIGAHQIAQWTVERARRFTRRTQTRENVNAI